MCLLVITLASVVTGQQAQPYQYPSPYQNAFNHDYRGYYSGFRGSSSPNSGETVRFPDAHLSPMSAAHGIADQNAFIGRHKKDMRNDRPNEDSFIPFNVTRGINTYEDLFNSLDEESQQQLELISPRSIQRNLGPNEAKPASCIPENTTVKLRLADESDVKDPTIFVFPPCTRVKRCGGCCSDRLNLISCQPVETNTLRFSVIKIQYQGDKLKLLNKEWVEVEEHTRCKCDCRKKESDCTKFQRYDKSKCMCYCINFEDQNKCSRETNEKIRDPESCACRCREVKDCSTGTYFDENSCSCQETPGRRHTDLVAERRRLIKKPVIYVPETPETYYDSGA